MKRCTPSLLRDEAGTVAMEYALIITIISVIALASMTSIGISVDGFFNSALAGLR